METARELGWHCQCNGRRYFSSHFPSLALLFFNPLSASMEKRDTMKLVCTRSRTRRTHARCNGCALTVPSLLQPSSFPANAALISGAQHLVYLATSNTHDKKHHNTSSPRQPARPPPQAPQAGGVAWTACSSAVFFYTVYRRFSNFIYSQETKTTDTLTKIALATSDLLYTKDLDLRCGTHII